MINVVRLALIGAIAIGAACRVTPSAAHLEADNPLRPSVRPPYGLEEFFAEAPPTAPARVRLGRWLFFDKRLSLDNSIACASCHRPEYALSDVVPASAGVGGQLGRRKTPSIVNLASRTVLIPAEDRGPAFFWDGRSPSLEQQVLLPIRERTEMGLEHGALVSRLSRIAGYAPYFEEAFGRREVTLDAVAAALADYVRTRMSGNAPYDRYEYGKNPAAISLQARRGEDLFFFKGRCGMCHAGFNFSDGQFHNLGVGWNPAEGRFADPGRAGVTGVAGDTGKFKTPGLRDVEKHPPYMHDGSLPTLRAVVEFYNRGGNANPWRSARIRRPLELTSDEIDALVAFLQSLTGEVNTDPGPKLFPQ